MTKNEWVIAAGVFVLCAAALGMIREVNHLNHEYRMEMLKDD